MNSVNNCEGWNAGAGSSQHLREAALAADVLTSGRSSPMIAIANRTATTGRSSQERP